MGYQNKHGFTIVELLIVIVVIAILAAITVVAYNGIQDRAKVTKSKSDITQLSKAIQVARIQESKPLAEILGTSASYTNCSYFDYDKVRTIPSRNLPKTSSCWTSYYNFIDKLAAASKTNLSNLRDGDPWGDVYYISEDEGSPNTCTRPALWTHGKNGVKAPPSGGPDTNPSFFDVDPNDATETSVRISNFLPNC